MIGRVVRRAAYLGPVRRAVTESGAFAGVRSRFVGGADESSAVSVADRLQRQGLMTTLHLREGNPTEASACDEHVVQYARLVAAQADAGLVPGTEVSVKLVQLGLKAPGGLGATVERLSAVVADAAARGIDVTVDMEGDDEVDDTLDAVRQVRATHPSLGVAVQAYLRRTLADCEALAATGARVRLVKGAYGAGSGIAHTDRAAIDAAYGACLRVLMAGDSYPMVASHDLRMVDLARDLARAAGRDRDGYEVQMLLGVRGDDQRRLVAAGERVRVYVPYGSDCYGWFVNRIVEKPSNVRLLGRALVSRGGSSLAPSSSDR